MEDVHFSSAQVGWIGGGVDKGLMGNPVLLKTTDGGTTWTSIDLTSLQIIKFVTLYPVSDQLLYTCGIDNSTGSLFNSPRVMYKSEDGGNTWRKLASTNFSNGSFGLYFFDAQVGLSVNISTVQKTTDGGVTWRTVFDEGLAGIDKLQCFKSGIGYAGGGNAVDLVRSVGILLKTTDRGDSWQKIPWPYGDIMTLSFLNERVGFVGTLDRHLYKTTDGGASWQVVDGLTPGGSRGVFLSEQEGYIAAVSTIEHTRNGGRSWQIEYTLPAGDNFGYLGFSPTGTGVIFTNKGLILKN